MSVTLLLGLAALVACIAAAVGKVPLWPSVLLLIVIVLLAGLPLK